MSDESQVVRRFRPSDAAPLRFWIWFALCAVAAVLVVLPTPTFVMVAAILTAFAGSAVSTRSESSRPFNPGFVIAISLGAVAIVGLFLLALTSGEPVGRPIPGWGRALLGVALALLLGAELLRYLRLKRRTAAA